MKSLFIACAAILLVAPASRVIESSTYKEFTELPHLALPVHAEQQPLREVTPESIAWDFFISKGYTREQTAGILGNLRQEHNYQTSDVPGGLGIAQWMNGRRDRLMAKENYTSLDVQLNFIIEELNSTESATQTALRNATTVEAATIAFQNKYERCGKCMQQQRINYALEAYARY